MGSTHSKDKGNGKKKKTRHVSLEVADETEKVHTVAVDEKLLSSHSSMFRRLSESGVLRRNKVIPLNNVTFLGLQRILQFMETGSVTFENYKEALETLQAGLEYCIDDVKDVCIEYLSTKLDTSNVCEIYEFAETHNVNDIAYGCLQIMDRSINEVLENLGFMKLKLPILLSITKRGNLNLRSEFCLLRAIVEWGKQEMIRRGVSSDQIQVFIDIISPALDNLRCKTMSTRKRNSSEYMEVYKYLSTKGSLSEDTKTFQRLPPRHYRQSFKHELGTEYSPQIALCEGDCFNLKIEVLKGRVFFQGVSLAFFAVPSHSASAAGLHVVLTSINDSTLEKKVVRDTFFNVNNDTVLKFKSPLTVKENESFTTELRVKLTGKVSPLTRRNDVDIFFSPERDVAMKIFPQKSSQKFVKCIFKEILYYF